MHFGWIGFSAGRSFRGWIDLGRIVIGSLGIYTLTPSQEPVHPTQTPST